MFKINRRIEYALLALKHMSQGKADKIFSAKEICEAYQMPFDPTSRVLQIMAQHDILKAEQGAYGGYKIVKNISKVSLLEIAEMLSGPIKIANCFYDEDLPCEITPYCNVIGPMMNLNQRISDLFASISIQELIDSRHNSEKIIRDRFKTRDQAH